MLFRSLAGFCGGDEKVGLAAEEGGDLEDVDGLAYGGAVLGGVDVGEDGETGALRYGAEDAAAFDEAGAPEAANGGAIGFVVTGFEDVGYAEVGGDALHGVRDHAGMRFRLDDAGPGDEKQLAAADSDWTELEGMRQVNSD